jgi:hypothetical protein
MEKKLATVLANAEAGVLEIIAAAAASRDYAAIDRARAIAERLRDINREVNAGLRVAGSPPPVYMRTQRKKRKTTPKKGEYPRFKVVDGSLFKIGWSKKKGDEYIHRVPIDSVKNISGALEQFSAIQGPVSSEQILESDFLKDAGNPPSYQVYIVLAFLKERGIIASTGREGFRLSSNIGSRTNELLRQEEEAA